jgi:hypothetical protein
MLRAKEVQAFLRQFEPLREVEVDELSEIIDTPWLVKVHGAAVIYGEPHAFEAELDLRQFGGAEDLMKLVEQLLKSFAAAAQVVNARAAA